MKSTPEDSHPDGSDAHYSKPERVVYVMANDAATRQDEDSIDIAWMWNVVWRKKWTIVLITAFFAIGSVAYVLTLTHWYRSEVLLAPAEQETVSPGIMGQLGSLAGLAGITVGGNGSVEALAILRSRDFIREFIKEQKLLPVLFADQWDPDGKRWLDEDPERWPNEGDAVRYFNTSLLKVEEDRQSGLVTVAVEWTEPELAAKWAALLVARLNDYIRARALDQAQSNLEYLQAELAATSVVTLQQAIGRLLEREHQKLMLARGNDEFAFRVIDSAEVPEKPSRPNRRLMVMAATFFGGVVAVFFVLARHLGTKGRRDAIDESTA